jgi:hypothetical protein
MDVLYDAVLGANTLHQIKRTSFLPSVESQSLRQSGALDPSQIVVKGAEPRVTFESMDLTGVLAACSVTGGLFVSSGTITIPWNRRANGGTFAGGSTNFVLNGTNGLFILKGISASQGDEGAVAEIEGCFLSTDGLTTPVTATVNQALGAQAYGTAYAMGPMYLDGTQLTQVESIRVDPGIALVVKRFDGSVYPTIAFIQERNPSIDVTFENFDALNTYGPLFNSMTTAAAYFRKKLDGGTFVTDVTAGHVQCSFGTGLRVIQGADASDTSNGKATMKIIGTALASSTAHAIP